MNRLRLKWKVFAFLLGFCALLIAILWLLQTVFLNDMYKFVRMQEMRQAIARAEKEIDNPELDTILFNMIGERDIFAARTESYWPPRERQEWIDRFSPEAPRGPQAITLIEEFERSDGQLTTIMFVAMIAPVEATVSTLRVQLYLVTAIVLVLSVVLAIVIAGRISRPIEDISQGAEILAKGDYDTRFSAKGFYEIAALSDTLNTAAVELGRVESLRRELMANVSHDLRTPLSLIYGYAEMMNDFPDEITTEQTKTIMDETQRLTTLVNDVLDISKLESEIEQLDPSRFSLTESVLKTCMRIEELLRSEGYEIVFEHNDEVHIVADETKIDRAFYNLLINAVNYSGESRIITVVQTKDGDHVRIGVTDAGEGIAVNDLPHIWDRYYKTDGSHKRAVTGTGLGLSIVKKIIDLHGGKYGVISDIGKGSTFWFEIRVD